MLEPFFSGNNEAMIKPLELCICIVWKIRLYSQYPLYVHQNFMDLPYPVKISCSEIFHKYSNLLFFFIYLHDKQKKCSRCHLILNLNCHFRLKYRFCTKHYIKDCSIEDLLYNFDVRFKSITNWTSHNLGLTGRIVQKRKQVLCVECWG